MTKAAETAWLLRALDGVLKCLGHTLAAPLHLAVFAAYRPKPEPSDTEEVFPLRFRGLSKYLLISVP